MRQALPLHPGAQVCVQCGYCCKIRSCGYGDWDEKSHRCKELIERKGGTYACRKYQEILESGEEWKFAPAFGAGCCSTLNSDRIAIVRRLEQGDGDLLGGDRVGASGDDAQR